MRPVISAAASVVPLPRNGSYTSSPRLMWFRIGRRIRSTGFCVGWSNFVFSDPPMMNFGEGDTQMVEFSPALPEPRRVLLSDVPAGLMLIPVMRTREHRSAFVPDNLLNASITMIESGCFVAIATRRESGENV